MIKKIIIFSILYFNINSIRDAIVIIDNSENLYTLTQKSFDIEPCIEAMTVTFSAALYQQFCPIIVTKNLAYNLINIKSMLKDLLNLDLYSFYSKYEDFKLFQSIEFIKLLRDVFCHSYNLYNRINKKSIKDKEKKYILHKINKKINKYLININSSCKSTHCFCLNIIELIICYSVSYENWIIKDVNKDFCLFIPKKYLNKLNINYNLVKYNNKKPNLTDIEKMLGFKVNHLKDIDIFDKKILNYYPPDYLKEDILNALDKLFVTHDNNYKWVFYCTGHGFSKVNSYLDQFEYLKNYYIQSNFSLNNLNNKINNLKQNDHCCKDSIIGLTKKDFRKFLNFLNNKINTKFLYYCTCFSGGDNLIKPYKNLILNYDVVSQGLSENFSYINCLTFNFDLFDSNSIDYVNKIKLNTTLNFKKYFRSLRDNLDLKSVIYYVNPYFELKNNKYYLKNIENMTYIRYRYSNRFELISGFENIKIIDKYNDRDINLDNKKLALIYADYIDKELILNKNLKAIVSMTEKNGHVFKKINAKNLNLRDVINKFLFTPELQYSKFFWIKDIECKDYKKLKNLIIVINLINSENIDQMNHYNILKYNYVYFETGLNEIYKITVFKNETITFKDCIEIYSKNYKQEILLYQPDLSQYLS